MGLITSVLATHLNAGALEADGPRIGEVLDVRADHALAGGVAAVVALAAFESLGLERARSEVALVGAERHAPQAAFESADELRELQQAAHRLGVLFSRPGDGRCERVHLEHFAAPTRVLASAGRRSPVAAALGMLTLPVSALELTAVMAGRPVELRWPGVREIAISGSLGPGVDGHDAALALHARLEDLPLESRFIEFSGTPLPVDARVSLAVAAVECGARSCLFPSEEYARAWLAAQGREVDWKRFVDESTRTVEPHPFDIDGIEPLTAPFERRAAARPVREVRGTAVEGVLIGPGASAEDLARFADLLGKNRVREGVTVMVVPGTRQVRETARVQGTLERLAAAGAQIEEAGARPVAATLGLCCGAGPGDLPPGRSRWQAAGIATCVAAALEGALEDPRRVLDFTRQGAAPLVFAAGQAPRLGSPAETPAKAPRFPAGRPFEGALRGVVLRRLGDDVTTEMLVPWGAKVRPLVGDLDALAEFTLDDAEPGFARHAREAGGGFLVAGERFGSGVAWDTAALAPVALGVRAFLARSIAPEFAHLAALSGILPLEFVSGADASAVATGDELEIPGLPEALAPGRALVARNLTQGTQYTVRHALDTREVIRLSRGGLLATLREPE